MLKITTQNLSFNIGLIDPYTRTSKAEEVFWNIICVEYTVFQHL